ncbi:MAG: dTDP-4-dehydrorhamnose reductase [Terricaulis sp.]
MTLLIVGKSGQVARALAREARARGDAFVLAGRPEVDLETFAGELPAHTNCVLNAAAYTQVDRAEDELERAHAINAVAPGRLAAATPRDGVFVHFSTDYVFAGDKSAPYAEDDPVAPSNAYGASKLEGERAVLAAHPRSIILRTAWVYDASGANFVRTMLRLAKTRSEVSVVADQKGCPTFATDLANVALDIAARPNSFGIYHCVGQGETTWAGFAEEIFRLSAERGGPSATVKAITTAEFPTRAKRPANSRLDCSKLEKDYGARMRPWREAVAECIDEVAANGWSVE